MADEEDKLEADDLGTDDIFDEMDFDFSGEPGDNGAPTLKSYSSNLIKSGAHGMMKFAEIFIPDTAEMISGFGDVASETIEEFNNQKSKVTKIISKKLNKENKSILQIGKDMVKTATDDLTHAIKTGDFRFETPIDLSKMFDEGDDDESEAAGTVKAISDGAAITTKANISIAEAANARDIKLYKQKEISDTIRFKHTLTHLSNIDINISKIGDFYASIGIKSAEAQLEYGGKMLESQEAIVKELNEIRKQTYVKKNADIEGTESTFGKVFGYDGLFNPREWFTSIKNNVTEKLDENPLISAIKMKLGVDAMGGGDSIGNSLMKGAIKFVTNSMINSDSAFALSNFDKTMKTLPMTMIGKLNTAATESTNPFMRLLGSVFGVNELSTKSVNIGESDINAKAMFDKAAHLSITKAIPGLLSKILSAVSGTGEIYYDYGSGMFKTVDQSIKEYEYAKENAYNNSDVELTTMRANFMSSTDDIAKEHGTDPTVLKHDFNQIFKNILDSKIEWNPDRIKSSKSLFDLINKKTKDPGSILMFFKEYQNLHPNDKTMFIRAITNGRIAVDNFFHKQLPEMINKSGTAGADIANKAIDDELGDSEVNINMLKERLKGSEEGTTQYRNIQKQILEAEERYRLDYGGRVIAKTGSSTMDDSIAKNFEQNGINGTLKNIYNLLLGGILVYPRSEIPSSLLDTIDTNNKLREASKLDKKLADEKSKIELEDLATSKAGIAREDSLQKESERVVVANIMDKIVGGITSGINSAVQTVAERANDIVYKIIFNSNRAEDIAKSKRKASLLEQHRQDVNVGAGKLAASAMGGIANKEAEGFDKLQDYTHNRFEDEPEPKTVTTKKPKKKSKDKTSSTSNESWVEKLKNVFEKDKTEDVLTNRLRKSVNYIIKGDTGNLKYNTSFLDRVKHEFSNYIKFDKNDDEKTTIEKIKDKFSKEAKSSKDEQSFIGNIKRRYQNIMSPNKDKDKDGKELSFLKRLKREFDDIVDSNDVKMVDGVKKMTIKDHVNNMKRSIIKNVYGETYMTDEDYDRAYRDEVLGKHYVEEPNHLYDNDLGTIDIDEITGAKPSMKIKGNKPVKPQKVDKNTKSIYRLLKSTLPKIEKCVCEKPTTNKAVDVNLDALGKLQTESIDKLSSNIDTAIDNLGNRIELALATVNSVDMSGDNIIKNLKKFVKHKNSGVISTLLKTGAKTAGTAISTSFQSGLMMAKLVTSSIIAAFKTIPGISKGIGGLVSGAGKLAGGIGSAFGSAVSGTKQLLFGRSKPIIVKGGSRSLDENGNLVDNKGRLIDKKGRLINEDGHLIDKKGNLIDNKGNLVDENGRLIDKKGNLINKAGDIIDEAGNIIENGKYNVKKLGKSAKKRLDSSVGSVSKSLNKVRSSGIIGSTIAGASGIIKSGVSSASDIVGNTIAGISNVLPSIIEGGSNVISSTTKGTFDLTGKLLGLGGGAINKVFDSITSGSRMIEVLKHIRTGVDDIRVLMGSKAEISDYDSENEDVESDDISDKSSKSKKGEFTLSSIKQKFMDGVEKHKMAKSVSLIPYALDDQDENPMYGPEFNPIDQIPYAPQPGFIGPINKTSIFSKSKSFFNDLFGFNKDEKSDTREGSYKDHKSDLKEAKEESREDNNAKNIGIIASLLTKFTKKRMDPEDVAKINADATAETFKEEGIGMGGGDGIIDKAVSAGGKVANLAKVGVGAVTAGTIGYFSKKLWDKHNKNKEMGIDLGGDASFMDKLGNFAGVDGGSEYGYDGSELTDEESRTQGISLMKLRPKTVRVAKWGLKTGINGISGLTKGSENIIKGATNAVENSKVIGPVIKFTKRVLSNKAVAKLLGPTKNLIGKILGVVKKIFNPKLFTKMGSRGVGRLLSRIAGPLGLALSLNDFISGWTLSSRFFHLGRGANPTFGMKLSSALANLLSGLTIGLVPAKYIAEVMYSAIGSPANKEFTKDYEKFNEERADVLGVDANRLSEYETKGFWQNTFGNDKKDAALLGFTGSEDGITRYRWWRDNIYDPVNNLYDKLSNNYGGTKVLSRAPSDELEREMQNEFRKRFLSEARDITGNSYKDEKEDESNSLSNNTPGIQNSIAGVDTGTTKFEPLNPSIPKIGLISKPVIDTDLNGPDNGPDTSAIDVAYRNESLDKDISKKEKNLEKVNDSMAIGKDASRVSAVSEALGVQTVSDDPIVNAVSTAVKNSDNTKSVATKKDILERNQVGNLSTDKLRSSPVADVNNNITRNITTELNALRAIYSEQVRHNSMSEDFYTKSVQLLMNIAETNKNSYMNDLDRNELLAKALINEISRYDRGDSSGSSSIGKAASNMVNKIKSFFGGGSSNPIEGGNQSSKEERDLFVKRMNENADYTSIIGMDFNLIPFDIDEELITAQNASKYNTLEAIDKSINDSMNDMRKRSYLSPKDGNDIVENSIFGENPSHELYRTEDYLVKGVKIGTVKIYIPKKINGSRNGDIIKEIQFANGDLAYTIDNSIKLNGMNIRFKSKKNFKSTLSTISSGNRMETPKITNVKTNTMTANAARIVANGGINY